MNNLNQLSITYKDNIIQLNNYVEEIKENNILNNLMNQNNLFYKNVENRIKLYGYVSIFNENFSLAIRIMNLLMDDLTSNELDFNNIELSMLHEADLRSIINLFEWENIYLLTIHLKDDPYNIVKYGKFDEFLQSIEIMNKFLNNLKNK